MHFPATRRASRPLLFVTLLLVALAPAARAQTDSALLLKTLPDDLRLELNSSALFPDQGYVRYRDTDARVQFFETDGRLRPLFRDFRAKPRFGYNLTLLNVQTNDPRLPNALLTDTSLGFGIGIFQGGEGDGLLKDVIAGLTVGVGYAGVGAFDDNDAWYYQATLVAGRTFPNGDQFGIVLDYDGNRTILPDVPLPGFQYRHTTKDPFFGKKLILGGGFPFSSLEWALTDRLTLTAKGTFPFDLTARADYKILKDTGLFVEYANRREAFHWDQFAKGSDRLFFTERRAEVGIRYTFNDKLEEAGVDPGLTFVLAGGWVFDQKFERGFDSRDTDTLAKLSDEPYVRVGLELRY